MPAKPSPIPAEHQTRLESIRAAWAQLEPVFRDATARLASAGAAEDVDRLQAARSAVESAGRAAAEVSSRVDFAVRVLFELQAGAGFADPAGRVDAMLVELGRIGNAALKAFTASKKLMDAADRKIEAAREDISDRQRLWARADAWLRMQFADRPAKLGAMKAVAKKADAAVAKRDAKALAAAQKEAAAIGSFAFSLAELRARTERAIKERGDVEPALRKQFEADARAWTEGLRAAEADELEFFLERDVIAAAQIAPRDARKAAQLLGIGNGDVAKLAKVLDGDVGMLMKGLEALRRQLQIEMPARDMLAALKKAQLV